VDADDRTPDMPVDRQVRLALGVEHAWSDTTTLGAAFTWVDLGNARISNDLLRGSYAQNEVYVLAFYANWARLPWGDRGTW
jgi:long-chain fatty acid transport protein